MVTTAADWEAFLESSLPVCSFISCILCLQIRQRWTASKLKEYLTFSICQDNLIIKAHDLEFFNLFNIYKYNKTRPLDEFDLCLFVSVFHLFFLLKVCVTLYSFPQTKLYRRKFVTFSITLQGLLIYWCLYQCYICVMLLTVVWIPITVFTSVTQTLPWGSSKSTSIWQGFFVLLACFWNICL